MAFHILDQVKRKTRDEWRALLKEKFGLMRVWVQENGEAGLFIGLLIGLFLVAFHKLVLALIALSVIVCFGLYMVAPEKPELDLKGGDSSSANDTLGDGKN